MNFSSRRMRILSRWSIGWLMMMCMAGDTVLTRSLAASTILPTDLTMVIPDDNSPKQMVTGGRNHGHHGNLRGRQRQLSITNPLVSEYGRMVQKVQPSHVHTYPSHTAHRPHSHASSMAMKFLKLVILSSPSCTEMPCAVSNKIVVPFSRLSTC